jgi:peptidoglycan/xylan/chitin deacetylase (PgdA/CDA1 family)
MNRGPLPPAPLALVLLLALSVMACGGGDASGEAPQETTPQTGTFAPPLPTGEPSTQGQPTASQPPSGQPPAGQSTPTGLPVGNDSATATGTAPPDNTIDTYPPNELGQIPILEYHHFGPEPEQFVRTPDQFRADLQWLYDNNFYVVNLHDILDDDINVPAGKRPVALTFDDSPASQFSLMPLSDGQLAIDPNCAVGILELFFAQHPDFGRGGHFSVLPGYFFDWTPTEHRADQTPHIEAKFRWLVNHGYEIGNHTLDHANLAKLDTREVARQLSGANDAIHAVLPDAEIRVITLPYGMYPSGSDATLLRGFEYEGRRYEWSAALLVGANPTVAPASTEFDPYAMARIQAFDAELDKWFAVFVEQPGILYVSDGDPATLTVPEDLHPWLVGTLDRSKLGGRELIRVES